MRQIGSHFVFAYILNCSTLKKFQFSVWSSAMPKETKSIKKKRNISKRGIAQWLPDYRSDYSGVCIGEGGRHWAMPPTPWRQPMKNYTKLPTNFFFLYITMEMSKFENFVIAFEFLIKGNRNVMQYFLLQPFQRNRYILCYDLHRS